MLRQIFPVAFVSAAILSSSIVQARSTVVSHNIDVDSVETCGVIARKNKNWILTDAIKTKTGARCMFSEIVEVKAHPALWTPAQPINQSAGAVGASGR
jgi:hypothetical protein